MRTRLCAFAALFAAMGQLTPFLGRARAQAPDAVSGSNQAATTPLVVTVGKSLLVETPSPIERVAVGYGDIAEVTAIGAKEVMLNGRTPGVTSLIMWQRGGAKILFDVRVEPSDFGPTNRVEAIDREMKRELPGQDVEMSYENETVFLRGHVKDMVSAERAVAIASTLGHAVNLLYVDVPPPEAQIMLKVRFATIDRSTSLQLGLNLVSTGAGNTIGGISTQQFSGPTIVSNNGTTTGTSAATNTTNSPMATLSDALNIFLFRSDLNLMATIQALQQKSLVEVLAEPNLLAINGKSASFLAGGQFPYPTFQAGAAGTVGAVTISFRDFGIRLNFTPTITPRGTIRLQVNPEVSALDFASGLIVQGFNVPALTVRRVDTEVELKSGQSFAIAGLIDNSFTETISKIPALGDLPILGKLFQSKSRTKDNTELIVIVTPELVAPLPAGQPVAAMNFPTPPAFPPTTSAQASLPGPDLPQTESIPFETLVRSQKRAADQASAPQAAQIPQSTGSAPPSSAPVSPGR